MTSPEGLYSARFCPGYPEHNHVEFHFYRIYLKESNKSNL